MLECGGGIERFATLRSAVKASNWRRNERKKERRKIRPSVHFQIRAVTRDGIPWTRNGSGARVNERRGVIAGCWKKKRKLESRDGPIKSTDRDTASCERLLIFTVSLSLPRTTPSPSSLHGPKVRQVCIQASCTVALFVSALFGIRSVNERLTEEAGIQLAPSCERAGGHFSVKWRGGRGRGRERERERSLFSVEGSLDRVD